MQPIMPLYIMQLGIDDPAEVAQWSGIVFGCTFVTLAIFSPIWGRLSDRIGCRPMILRAIAALAIGMILMGMAKTVYELAFLRLLQGCLSGFMAAIIPLIALETPKERNGWAMSIFFTSQVTGGLLGPLFGGWLGEMIGFRNSFLFIGICCWIGFLACTQLKEAKRPVTIRQETATVPFRSLPMHHIIIGIFLTTFLMHFSLTCIGPILTVYVQEIAPDAAHIALISGAIFASTGLASMIFASRLGELSDRIGPAKILLGSLLLIGIITIPQAMVTTPIQLMILRFIHGIALAGLIPSINSLIRSLVPKNLLGRIYGINQSCQFIGMFTGAFLGGYIAASLGIRALFLLVAALFIINAIWCWKIVIKKITFYSH